MSLVQKCKQITELENGNCMKWKFKITIAISIMSLVSQLMQTLTNSPTATLTIDLLLTYIYVRLINNTLPLCGVIITLSKPGRFNFISILFLHVSNMEN